MPSAREKTHSPLESILAKTTHLRANHVEPKRPSRYNISVLKFPLYIGFPQGILHSISSSAPVPPFATSAFTAEKEKLKRKAPIRTMARIFFFIILHAFLLNNN